MTIDISELLKLSHDEKRCIIAALTANLPSLIDTSPIERPGLALDRALASSAPLWQRQELDRRETQYSANDPGLLTWEEAQTRILACHAFNATADITALAQAVNLSGLALGAMTIAHRLIDGVKPAKDHPYAWLDTFSDEDLKTFIGDIATVFEKVVGSPDAWSKVETVINEWNDRAATRESGSPKDLFCDPLDEVRREC